MIPFDPTSAQGHMVRLSQTNPRHLSGSVHEAEESKTGAKNFGNLVSDALNDVNDLTKESEQLTQQFITDPDSVDPHDVTIAMNKANLAVSMTKKVVDEVIKAYTEIKNLR
jgi:flagellar hook-basal body complex protein FliE